MRTGALLAVIGVVRLARTARARWRISLVLAVILEVLGHSVLTGPARGAADLLGLVVVTVAVLKSAAGRGQRGATPQAGARWHGYHHRGGRGGFQRASRRPQGQPVSHRTRRSGGLRKTRPRGALG